MTTLFLIDDDELIIKSFRRIFSLHKDRYEPRFFTNPEEALQALGTVQPDFIFTDIGMNHMNGWEFLKRAKKLSPRTVFTVISGDADEKQVMGVADFFLEKPCRLEDLTELMEERR